MAEGHDTPQEHSPDYEQIYTVLTWETASWEDRLDFIISCGDGEEWYTETALTVLGHFRHIPHIWGRIKARAIKARIYGKEIESAVDSWLQLHPSANGATPTPPVPAARKRRSLTKILADETWREDLVYTAQGDPKQTAANISLLLEHHPSWHNKLWWDEVRGRAMVAELPLSEEVITDVMLWLQTAERLPTTMHKLVERCLVAQCHKTPRDLLREGLAKLPSWDGIERLDDWLADIAGVEKTAYTMAVARKLLVSMVARVMEPGCLYRFVVILEGPEEFRKSTLVQALPGEEWYVTLSMGLESKESHMMLQGAWVAEMPELDSLSRTEETRLKAFITLKEDSYIPKYSNFRLNTPRRTIFIGTTNEESYLKGQTGNTRFLPVKTMQVIAIDDFLQIRDQLLAEALVYYKQHLTDWWVFPDDALPEARAMRDARRIVNVYEEPLREWLSFGRFVDTLMDNGHAHLPESGVTTWHEIARWFLKMESPERWKDITLQKQIAAALKAIGWEQHIEWGVDSTGKKKSLRLWREGKEGRGSP